MPYIFIDNQNLPNIQNYYDFKVQLSNRINIQNHIKLIQANVVFDELLINQHNNIFYVNGTQYTLDTRNYTMQTLCSQIQQQVQINLSQFFVVFDLNKQQIKFQNDSIFSFSFDNKELQNILGFKQQSYSGYQVYYTEFSPQINAPNNIFIQINELANSDFTHVKSNEISSQFIIPLSVQRTQVQQYQNLNNENTIHMRRSIDSFTVKILKSNSDFFETKSSVQLLFYYC